jgi:MFS transporter, MHS family, alpha-ketoglutarate permease
MIPTPASAPVPVPAQGRAKVLTQIGIGNALEWFDWTIYAIFAGFFASQFFDATDPVSAVLSTLAVFAVGFFARPFGGFLFGWIGDRSGRRTAMTVSVGTAAAGSLLIGAAPTFDQIGVGASLLLLFARLAQGLAHGGELPSAQTYVAEVAPAQRRGLWSSFIYVSGTAGIMVGTLMGAVLATALSEPAMAAWGWRVPFLFGGVLGVYALVMRRRMAETETFSDAAAARATEAGSREPVWVVMKRHRKQMLQVIGITLGITVVYYAWAIAAPGFAMTRGVDKSDALWAGVVANLVFIAALPAWGALSDRIGRKPVSLGCCVALAVAIFPLNAALGDTALQLGVTMSLALLLIAGPAAIGPALFAELFPTRIRVMGFGVAYSLAVATFGGTVPYLQTWVASHIGVAAFNGYVVAALLVSAAVVTTLPETRGRSLVHTDAGEESLSPATATPA